MKGAAPHVDILHGLIGGNYQGQHAPALSLALDGMWSSANDLLVAAAALDSTTGLNSKVAVMVRSVAERLTSLAIICHEEDDDKVPGDNGPCFRKEAAS